MKYTSSNIDIFSEYYQGELGLHFKFKGKFTEEASRQSSRAWHEEMDANPLNQYVLIWDCLEMAGFEISARKLWYEYMNLHKKQIEHVVVISGSILIRNAARVMLEFFGLSSTVVKTHEQFEELKEMVQL